MSESPGIIAWKGRLELLDAAWSLKSGRTVRFNIIQEVGAPITVHPFAGFVKRRGNRVGSRFHLVAVHPGSTEPIYDGQVMLISGGSPLGRPMYVEFAVDNDEPMHPFDGCTAKAGTIDGQEFAAVFVELAPDETPVDQTQRDLMENATAPKPHATSRYAAWLCQHPFFHQYLSQTSMVQGQEMPPEFWAASDQAVKWMRWKCGVKSRSEFDTSTEAAFRFHNLVREPYAEWCQERGYDDLR